MRDILDTIDKWHKYGEEFAIATVIRTWGSAPRQPGAKMAVSRAREFIGSVGYSDISGYFYCCSLCPGRCGEDWFELS